MLQKDLVKKELIGAQIIAVHEKGFAVRTTNGAIHSFLVEEDEGDCCGYNTWDLKVFRDNIKRNPIITNIQWDEDDGESSNEHTAHITLFGEYAPLVQLDSLSSSGSGWSYGATVTLRCVETDEQYIVTAW